MTAGTHGSTFGGNPLAMAVGNSVMDIIANKNFLKHVKDISKYFLLNLNKIKENEDLSLVPDEEAVRDGLGRVKDQGEFPGDLGAFGMFGMKGMAEGVGAVKLIKNEGFCTGGANGVAFAEISFEEEFECIDLLQSGRTATGEGEVGIQGCRKVLFDLVATTEGSRISPSSCRGGGLGFHCGDEVRVMVELAAPGHIKGHAFQSHANLLAVALFDPLEKGNLCGVDDEHRF